jgi:ankyrin repeat protein
MSIRSIAFIVAMTFGTVAFGQVHNDRLYNDIASGEINELNLSLSVGIDPNTELLVPGREDLALSLMELSLAFQNDDAAALLLQVGAGFDYMAEGRYVYDSPLMVLAEAGMSRTLTAYIDRDNSVLIEHGGTALILAVAAGHWPIAQLLLDRTIALVGQDQIQAPLEEALIFVARKNDVAATQMLLELGADPSSGLPLLAAVGRCSPDTVAVLIAYSADALPYYEGKHVASYAQQCLSEGFAESDEEAVDDYSQTVQLLYESDSTICPVLIDVQRAKTSRVDSVLKNLGICQ